MAEKEKQIVTRERVRDHGEVYTSAREVNAMLDLVDNETRRLDSRFLEPACGNGNFLSAILERKLRLVTANRRLSLFAREIDFLRCVAGLYGIDIIASNVAECRERLLAMVDKASLETYRQRLRPDFEKVLRFILSKNIIHGNARSYKTMDAPPRDIIFSEWSMPDTRGKFVRRDYPFESMADLNMLNSKRFPTDNGEEFFRQNDVREYRPVLYLRLPEQENT